ncbi:MAG: SulP family inorganic anion transporter [Spirochaetia bacterium]|nr:SulP family inorganic anion transporter [Spirochaetia bacterium]
MNKNQPEWFIKFFPFTKWFPMVGAGTLKFDVIAGLTGALVVLPQGVAFASIAGMPPEYGLYAGMVPAIIAALFGSSWHLVSGPTTAASIVILSSLSGFAEPTTEQYIVLAFTLTFMVGVIELILGIARMGEVVSFISHSVIVGFTAGAAILIGTKQLKNFFGVPIPRGGHLHDILYHFTLQVPNINYYAVAVGLVTILSGLLIKKLFPKFPYLIVSMFAGTGMAIGLDMMLGKDVTQIATIGSIPDTLPPLSSPDFSFKTIQQLFMPAIAITLFALTEAVSISKSIGMRSGQRIDGNQEFIAQGLSNIAGSFFSGYVATGSFNRSGLNYQAGAKTPVAAILAGLFLIPIVIFVAPYSDYIPNAAMAGILFIVAWGLIDFKAIKHILHSSKRETAIFIVVVGGALFIDLEVAIFSGVILSLVFYLMRVAHPNIVPRVPDARLPGRKFTTDLSLPECPQLKIVRVDGALFFGSVNYVEDYFDEYRNKNPEQKYLAIVSSGIHFTDIAGGEALVAERKRRKSMGGDLFFINPKKQFFNTLDQSGSLATLNPKNFFGTKGAALAGIYNKLDKTVCEGCTARIFNECPKVKGKSVSVKSSLTGKKKEVKKKASKKQK